MRLFHFKAFIAVTIALTLSACATQRKPSPEEVGQLAEEAAAAQRAVYQNRCEEALEQIARVEASPAFDSLDERLRIELGFAQLECANELQRMDVAHEALKRLITYSGYDEVFPFAYEYQLIFALNVKDAALAEDVLIRAERVAPSIIHDIDIQHIWTLADLVGDGPDGDAGKLRVLDRLLAMNYRPDNGLADLDYVHIEHIGLLIRAGRVEEARTLAERIIIPDALAQLATNRDYEPVWDAEAFKARTADYKKTAETYLEIVKQRMAENPGRIQMVLDVINALRTLGRSQEAADMGEPAAARLEQADHPVAAGYSDAERVIWFLNDWAYALIESGQQERGFEVMRRASGLPEYGSPNVSQAINLSILLLLSGAYDEALVVVDGVPATGISTYGRMLVNAVRVCAPALKGDMEKAESYLPFTETYKHEADQPYVFTMLCLDRKDAAAAHFLARLADGKRRDVALKGLQDYRRYEFGWPVQKLIYQRLDEVRASTDVRAAAEKVGRLQSFPINSLYWGDM